MNDVSVQNIDALYGFCSAADHFTDHVQQILNMVRSDMHLIRGGTLQHVDCISNALDEFHEGEEQIRTDLDSLRDELHYEEDRERRQDIRNEMDSLKDNLKEVRTKRIDCKADLEDACRLEDEIECCRVEVESIVSEMGSSIRRDVDSCIEFVKKYARFLESAKSMV